MDSRAPSGRSGRRGFTLVELLVAMTITIIFGTMVVITLRYGSSLWRAGHRRGYAYDTATTIFQQLEGDLATAKNHQFGTEAAAVDSRVRFYVDFDANGRQRLLFVRGIAEHDINPRLRQAGDMIDNDLDGLPPDEEVYNLQDDDTDGLVDEDLMWTGGISEVGYMMGLGDDGDTLYRGVYAPITYPPAGPDAASLFLEPDPDPVSGFDPTDGTSWDYDANISTASDITDRALPLADGILYFELRCWSQYTTVWDMAVDADAEDFNVWSYSYLPEYCTPTLTWDSDRLTLAPVGMSPVFALDPGQPGVPASPGETDPWYVADNVFPRQVMVVVVVQPPDRLSVPNPLRLSRPLVDTELGEFFVRGGVPTHNEAWPYVRINDEWIRFTSIEPVSGSDETRFVLDPNHPVQPGWRRARGTAAPATHDVGDRVDFGFTFSRVIQVPAGRDYWGQ